MPTLTKLILATCQQAINNQEITNPNHIWEAIEVYHTYFEARLEGWEEAASNYPAPVDRLLDQLEDALTQRHEQGLDAMLVPAPYPTEDHLWEDAFAEADGVFRDAEARGMSPIDFLTTIPPFTPLDRQWLLTERGIRITPNPVRDRIPELPDPTEADLKDEESREAYALEVIRKFPVLVHKYPDNPALVTGYLMSCEDEDEFAELTTKHLRPLPEFPAGDHGFYHDEEYIEITLAYCRLADYHKDVTTLYRLGEDLLRLGVAEVQVAVVIDCLCKKLLLRLPENQLMLSLITANPPLPRPEYPLVSALVPKHYADCIAQITSQPEMNNALGDILPSHGPAMHNASPDDLLQIRVDIQGAKPPIWRRLLIPATTPLEEVHRILQIAFDWRGHHLHNFIWQEHRYFGPADPYGMDDVELYDDIRLGDLLRKEGDKLGYWYDFGDDWHHVLKVEKVLPLIPGQPTPACIGGNMAAPPDDSGGIWGYAEKLDTLAAGPKHREYESVLEWLGDEFDPKEFNPKRIDARLKSM